MVLNFKFVTTEKLHLAFDKISRIILIEQALGKISSRGQENPVDFSVVFSRRHVLKI
jgi:hypothetical protein